MLFEPLPSFVRLHREQRNLSQERLAKLAGVSRGQLVAFEKGEQNISLLFLLKIAKALELTELPVGELTIRAAPTEVTTLILAADAIAAARKVVAEAAGAAGALDATAASIEKLLNRALQSPGVHPAIPAAAKRLPSMASPPRALRDLAESPNAVARASRAKADKPATRKRSR